MAKGATDAIWIERLRQKPRSAQSAGVQRLLHGFEQSQWFDADRMAFMQLKRLEQLLPHARQSVPYYAKALPAAAHFDAASLQAGQWQEIPILSRAALRDGGDDMLSRAIPRTHGDLDITFTSGTTGQPVRAVRTQYALAFWSAFKARDHIWHNRDISGNLVVIRSAEAGFAPYPAGQSHAQWGAPDDVFETGPSYSLNINSRIPDMADFIARSNADYLLTMPSVLRRLAQYCVDNDVAFDRLKGVQTIAETCGDLVRALCRDAWGVAVQDVYTSREIGYMALQCPVHDHLHIQGEGVLLEILDESGRPCAPGEIGRVVVTSLSNYAMPLIRYEVGDFAELGPPCDCGRGLPVIKRIIGREQELLTLPTGEQRWTLIGGLDLQDFIRTAPIQQYQFAHVAAETIELRLVTERALTTAEEDRLAGWVRTKFAYPFAITFAYRDDIPRTAGGKFQSFVNEYADAGTD